MFVFVFGFYQNECWLWGFGVYSILLYDDMFQVLITSLNQSLLVEKKFRKPHDRQIFEGVMIAQNERRDHLMNSNAQFHAPAVPRVRMTREIGS